MNEEPMTGALAREFLLGKLDDNEHNRIESLFLTDAQARELMLTAEQDLIEDYFEDSLTNEDKQRFLTRFAQTGEQRQKLRITKSIRDRALVTPYLSQAAAASVSPWSRLRKLQLKPVFLVPIAVGIVLALVLAIVWLNSRMEQRKHFAVEQELAQLNSPTSMREVPAQLISLELHPVTVRSVEPQAELKLNATTRIVELRLPWIQKEQPSTYQAEIRQIGSNEAFTIRDLRAERDGDHIIRVRIPTSLLSRGNYQIRLTGLAPDGTSNLTEEYIFTVRT